MSKKSIIIISVIAAVIVIGIIIGVIIIKVGNDEPPVIAPPTTEDTTNTIVIPPIDGNKEIAEEREVLLDQNIISVIDNATAKIPVVGDDGNYLTDENGNLIYENAHETDYTNVKENLFVIVNAFADAGYPDTVIKYVQRFYFEYYDQLTIYETDELIEKLMYCFTISGNTTDQLSKAMFETFGFDREDEFAFVFDEVLPPSVNKVLFFDVKPNIEIEWTEELENHCIYNIWHNADSDDHYERNMESYLHAIIYSMCKTGANDFDIRLAQLLYCSFMADVEYSADWLNILLACFSEGTPDYDNLRNDMLDKFGFDIYGNQLISFYYEGITEYNTEVK